MNADLSTNSWGVSSLLKQLRFSDGSVMNIGTLANPATGGCLGVAGGTRPGERKSRLNLMLTQCADPLR